jgi:hypothetical protein
MEMRVNDEDSVAIVFDLAYDQDRLGEKCEFERIFE